MTIPHPPSSKQELRQQMRRLMKGQCHDSASTCRAVRLWVQSLSQPSTIASFSALNGEVDLDDLVTQHPNHRWLYPRINGDGLHFCVVRDPASDLQLGAHQILEPRPQLEQVTADQIDAFLCPGLAFDAHGGRLGRGRGFYDRALSTARKDAQKVGVCFPFQRVTNAFCEAHDIAMDEVIDGA